MAKLPAGIQTASCLAFAAVIAALKAGAESVAAGRVGAFAEHGDGVRGLLDRRRDLVEVGQVDRVRERGVGGVGLQPDRVAAVELEAELQRARR
jgi:hypothetical protein